MSTELAARPDAGAVGEAIERVLIAGDLSRLQPQERVEYYNAVCKSLGLNPLTKPFEYIKLNGKEVLYATRACSEQLRKIHGVSIIIVARDLVDGVYAVTARATDRSGRTDESVGAVPLGNLQGEARANAMMKAETKAKRRVTLSICGLGMLDEIEVDSIQGAQRVTLPETVAPPLPRPATPPPVQTGPRVLSPEESAVFDGGAPSQPIDEEEVLSIELDEIEAHGTVDDLRRIRPRIERLAGKGNRAHPLMKKALAIYDVISAAEKDAS